jgi:glycerol-3-phosphate dehydrogenase (NAD(P)+)
MIHVGVIGRGDGVEALARVAVAAGSRVTVAGAAPDGFAVHANATGLVRDVDLVILCLPTSTFREEVRALELGPAARVLVATRGLEAGTGKRLSEVLSEESACLRVGALAGPLLLAEIRRKSPCAAVVASRFDEVVRLASSSLHSNACRIYGTEDLPGVELAGALVEVLGIAMGVSRGLGLGVGVQALLVSRGVAEGARLSAKGGGDPRTFAGLAGVGELVAGAALPDHPAHVRGLALARGEPDPEAAALCNALLGRVPDLPITAAIRALATGKARAADVLSGLMAREHREEFDA